MLTTQGKIMLWLCVLLYGASLTSQSGLLLLPIGLIGGCFLVNYFAAGRSVARLELIAPIHAHAAEGERLEQPWQVNNSGSRKSGFVIGESALGPLFRIVSVGARATVAVIPNLAVRQRGVYPHSEIRLSSTYPFGLIKAQQKVRIPGEVVVHPKLYDAASPRAAGLDPVVGGKHSGNRRSTDGSSFVGVRPMRPGDPFKHIHWKSSSKGQGLMVKLFQEELSGRIGFIIDCTAGPTTDALDNRLRAAGSLMFAALDEGHHIEWVDLENGKAELFPPFSDGQEILDRLARMTPDPQILDHARMARAVDCLSRKSAVCLVVESLSDAVHQTVRQLEKSSRPVTIYLPITQARSAEIVGCSVMFYSPTEIVEAT